MVNITRVDVSQGDTGRTLVFKLYDGLIPFTPPTGSTVTIVGRKPSGLGFSETCTVSGNTAVIDTTLAMTQEAGKFPVELRIESDTRSIGTANFMMHVEPSPHPEGTTDGTTEEARTVLEQCEAYAELAQEAAEAASGDYTEIKSDVEDLEDRVDNLSSIERPNGVISTTWSDKVNHFVFPVASGDSVKVKANASYPSKVVFLKTKTSAAGTTPDFAGEQTTANTVSSGTTSTYTAPSDATYVAVIAKRISGTPVGADYTPESVQVNDIEVLSTNLRQELYKNLSTTKTLVEQGYLTLLYRNSVPTNTDLNDVTQAGVYLLFVNRIYDHSPVTGGWLIVINNGSQQQAQIIYELYTGQQWYRRCNAGTWEDWTPVGFYATGSYIAFGDSITRGQMQAAKTPLAGYTIPQGIADACHLSLTNAGVSGQGFCKTANDLLAIDTIQATDISGANLITIAYGRNDASYSLGTVSDTPGANTICGRLKEALAYITSTNKRAQVVVITPTPNSTAGYTEASSGGWTLRDLENAFKTICADYHVGLCTWEECTLTAHWSDFSTDGTHPNETAYKYLSAYMGGQVGKYFSNSQTLI